MGLKSTVVPEGRPDPKIIVAHDNLPAEAYTLSISRQAIRIWAGSRAGFAYAATTVRQLGNLRSTPVASIEDRPAYRWRGIHLDVSRHFFSLAAIERFLDVAARYKLNVFHWHLTDNEAWRLQITRYPGLTARNACIRSACEYYTPADAREVVAYARTRNITVVPEIDLPGHSIAALRSYPQFACGDPSLFCATPSALSFLQNVLTEVLAIFPSAYIHVGGDEAPAASEHYFMPRLEAFLRSHHRRIVGWDEILDSGVSPAATIMCWHGDRRAIAALKAGHDVVMVPDGPLYFNAYQGAAAQEPLAAPHLSTLEQVYSYDPTPDGLSARERAHILGAEATLWTEKIGSRNLLDYMALPRMLALSEITWTPPARKSWPSFLARLPAQLAWLDRKRYRFRPPSPIFSFSGGPMRFSAVPGNVNGAFVYSATSPVRLTLSDADPNSTIRYTIDGSTPARTSRLYRAPVLLPVAASDPLAVNAAAFREDGTRSAMTQAFLRRVSRGALKRIGGSHAWAGLVSP